MSFARVHRVGPGPLSPDDGPLGARILRRIRGIGVEVVGFALVTVLLPLLLLIAAGVDLARWLARRTPWVGVRLVAMGWWFLFGELRGLLSLVVIWALTRGPFGRGSLRRRRWIYDLRIRWARSHLGGVRALFGLTFEVEGLEVAGPGPVLIFMRHASIIDNTMPDALIGREHGLGLRFVLKRELQLLPVIDIGGRWVPTDFVRRASADAAGEVARLRGLGQGLGADEAILIYPEGTRSSPEKLARAKQVIAERQPEIAELAARLKHLLPPRLGGPLALLEGTRGTDVVFCGHEGFDGFAKVSDIWSGGLVGTTVHVRLWRYPASDVPESRDDRVTWLYDRWQEVDDWVGGFRPLR